jgi:hypothetical protein
MGTPDPTGGTRSGALNGVLWGVSRATADNNSTQGLIDDWAASMQDQCGTQVEVAPDRDVNMCDGRTVESVNDSGGQNVLAMYPRQPFNFAARTGIIEFNVSDNTQGMHGAWPTLVITDQPVPAPSGDLSGLMDNARNSVGIDLGVLENNSESCLTADIWDTANYAWSSQPTTQNGCVNTSPGPGVMNHVEVQISSTGVKVFMSQPGEPNTTTLIASSSFAVPLAQGLVWLEDSHYNGDKFNSQQTNTFTWSDLAFDGPVEPRDLGFDVPDNNGTMPSWWWKATEPGGTAENGLPMTNLGYPMGPTESEPATAIFQNVTGVANASGALLCLSYYPTAALNINYSVNGNTPLTSPWPYANDTKAMVGPTYVSQSECLPVPLSEVRTGTNTITVWGSDADNSVTVTANYDLILQGAGGTVPPA